MRRPPPKRGALHNPASRFDPQTYEPEEIPQSPHTTFIPIYPKTLVNVLESPDLGGIVYSMNPYAGCEHGCIYCYARNSHEYWGYSAGVEFETRILVKVEAPKLLQKELLHPSWKVAPIMLAGNTDCYQPAERHYRLTRRLLEVLWAFRHPVSIITKNALILRDLDLLQQLAAHNLIHVYVSITTMEESLRRFLEPRTATITRRLEVVHRLSQAGIPTGVMAAPMIPPLNSHELLSIMEAAAKAGAQTANYTLVRLNGALAEIFEAWLREHFPDKADKVLSQIAQVHGGQLNDNRWHLRLKGEGPFAELLHQTYRLGMRKFFSNRGMPPFNLSLFRRGGMQSLFS